MQSHWNSDWIIDRVGGTVGSVLAYFQLPQSSLTRSFQSIHACIHHSITVSTNLSIVVVLPRFLSSSPPPLQFAHLPPALPALGVLFFPLSYMHAWLTDCCSLKLYHFLLDPPTVDRTFSVSLLYYGSVAIVLLLHLPP